MPRSELHDLMVKLGKENEGRGLPADRWRVEQACHRCSNMTVRKVLRRHGLEPAPRRSQRSWREFVRQHTDQILATNLFGSLKRPLDEQAHPDPVAQAVGD